jgi:hypothetical protein
MRQRLRNRHAAVYRSTPEAKERSRRNESSDVIRLCFRGSPRSGAGLGQGIRGESPDSLQGMDFAFVTLQKMSACSDLRSYSTMRQSTTNSNRNYEAA